MYRMRLLGTWDTWGDDDVLLRAEYTRRHRAVATTYLHVLSIGPDALEAICSSSDPVCWESCWRSSGRTVTLVSKLSVRRRLI